jgi:general secretion pathway protein I
MPEAGFSLLEVLFAVAILAIALPVLLGLRNRDVAILAEAQQITEATFLAQEKLLEAEMSGPLPFGEVSGNFAGPPPGYQTTEGKDRGPGYRWKRTVTTTPLELVREVRVQVFWPRGSGEDSVEVTAYVFQSL